MRNILNAVCNKWFSFKGPADDETTNRDMKFPVVNVQAIASAGTVEVTTKYREEICNVTVAEAMTINLASASTPEAGDIVTFNLANDGTQRVVTFGTGFKASGTVTGTINKTISISFKHNGSAFIEMGARSAAITA